MIQEKDEKTQPEKSGPLVLVVDDSAAIMDVYHFVLVEAGYRVATAPDGGVGLLLAKELRPSIIILDLMMPKVSGLEVPGALAQGSPGALATSHRQFRPR